MTNTAGGGPSLTDVTSPDKGQHGDVQHGAAELATALGNTVTPT